jgi:polysaccharide export outer membrane protein
MRKQEEKAIAPSSPQGTMKPKEKLSEEKQEEEKKQAEIAEPAIAVQEPASEGEEREYYLDVGDVLDISVWQIPDLSKPEVIVRPDGKISFPLIGDIKAEGLTLTQLDNIITEKLKLYVKTPEVSIMIRRFGEQANKVVILGEIPVPGVYKFSGPPSITELIASAGGYSKYAVLNSIMVIRGDVKTKPEVIRVNFAQIIKSGRLTENIFLKPNDIVYVPRSFIGNVNTFLEIFQPAFNEYMQTLNVRHLQDTIHRKGGI